MSTSRYSRQREALKKNLEGRKDHPTAYMVYEDLRKEYPNISLGTVYRNLSFLAEAGEIQKLPMDNGTMRFDWNERPHDHFCCTKCGKVIDMERVDTTDLTSSIQHKFKGRIDKCSVMCYGICQECLEKNVK